MKTIQKSVLLWHSAAEMFALVLDVASYPLFLPWCDQATVLERGEGSVTARIGIALSGLRQSFTTRNHYEPNRRMTLQLVEGPFSELSGLWQFTPLEVPGQGSACKVELRLEYGFSSTALAALVGPVFDKIATSLVDAFVKRADEVYGNPSAGVGGAIGD